MNMEQVLAYMKKETNMSYTHNKFSSTNAPKVKNIFLCSPAHMFTTSAYVLLIKNIRTL